MESVLTKKNSFIEIAITCQPETAEIAVAFLAEAGFESFVEDNGQLLAYCQKTNYNPEQVESSLSELNLHFQTREVEDQNWNQTWEENFQPIYVDDKLYIRASHHAPANKDRPVIEIIIDPKMSFGTGHHATTSQMCSLMLGMDLIGTSVLDAGSGTAILAILAEKLGAHSVTAFDHEDWATENAKENLVLNACQNTTVQQLDIYEAQFPARHFNVVLANITRNMVTEFLPQFKSWCKPEGYILCSGFITEDAPVVKTEAEKLGLTLFKESSLNNWAAIAFQNK